MTVTALCTLWGRPLHSLRWMWHMNRIHFPYPILLADGGPEQGLDDVLRDRSLFPNLTYEYLRFRDLSVDDYFRKVATAGAHASTPYVMLCDNDDFVLPSGIAPALSVLRADDSVASSGGRVVSFSPARSHRSHALDGVRARVNAYVQGGTFEAVDGTTALARVRQQIDHKVYGTYYSLQKRDAFVSSWERLRQSGIRKLDIGVGEFLACQVLTHGKGIQNPGLVIHMRQMGSSSVGATLPTSAERWADPEWQADLARMAEHVGREVAAVDGCDPQDAIAQVMQAMRDKRAPKASDFVPPTGLSGVARKLFRMSGGRCLLEHLRIARENARGETTRQASLTASVAHLQACGASPAYVAEHLRDVAEMEATLQSPAMADFVTTQAKRFKTS